MEKKRKRGRIRLVWCGSLSVGGRKKTKEKRQKRKEEKRRKKRKKFRKID